MKRPYEGVRKILNFNTHWLFCSSDQPHFADPDLDTGEWERVNLPHSNRLVPHQDFSPAEYQFVSWYRRDFELPAAYRGKRIAVEFDGVMSAADVYVNGKQVGTHKGGYTSFSFDITRFVKWEEPNVIAVRVDSTRRTDIPPEGHIVDYMLFGGIYRNVYLYVMEPCYIADTFLYTREINPYAAHLHGEITLVNEGERERNVTVSLTFKGKDPDREDRVFQTEVTVPGRGRRTVKTQFIVREPKLWSLENPHLYDVLTELQENGEPVDDSLFRFGIRTIQVEAGGVRINGLPVKLRGLNRHQMFPFVGNAAPKRLQRKDALILKQELGLNYVRTSHYPQDPHFLDACDELGLLVFTETPGWQHIGDETWKEIVYQNVREMVLRDRNHPSIFMWGVRINESRDDHDLYMRTNEIARSLDPSRPTGGVRNFQKSEFIEDIFTFNDFSMGALPAVQQPQLITEYMGHMYPTKTYDPESRLVKHALYHASIVNEVCGREDLVGSSGWCAFDYNTHSHFGSGSMICYHGVMDIFRHPKFAAYFYESQKDPKEGRVLFIATHFVSASPEHAELIYQGVDPQKVDYDSYRHSYTMPIYVFSNCEEVELWANGQSLGRKEPSREEYPHLPHPPFRFEIPAYRVYGELRAVGYVKGKEVMTQSVHTPQGMASLCIKADDDSLVSDGADMTRVTVEALDGNGHPCPYANRAIQFTVEGEGELIGENPIAMEAGRISVYVRSTLRPGTIRVKAKAYGVPETELLLQSTPMSEPIVPLP
jgi:beta-galactosidase